MNFGANIVFMYTHLFGASPRRYALGKSAAECALVQEKLSYLTIMLTGAEWLSEPDVPVTVKVA